MNTTNTARCFLALLAMSLLLAPAAAAQGNFEIFAGAAYSSEPGDYIGTGSVGLRGGYRFTDRWGLQGSLSRVESFDLYVPYVDFGVDATYLDASAVLFVTPRRKAELFFYGGVGVVFIDADAGIRFHARDFAKHHTRVAVSASDEELTAHLGVGVNIKLTQRMYLRPDLRLRWLGGDNDSTESETTLGLGWRF